MKTRTGFVSNSSSSSFIVAFDKTPQSVGEMQKILFGDKKTYEDPYDEDTFPASQVAETVFNDLKNPLSINDIVEEIRSGSFEGFPDLSSSSYRSKDKEVQDKAYAQWETDINEAAEKLATKFLKKNRDKTIFLFSYADEDGKYHGALEHGDLFDRLPHIRISKH